MVIAPSGKRRFMVAQGFDSPTSQLNFDGIGQEDIGGVGSSEEVPGPEAATQLKQEVDQVESEQEQAQQPKPGTDKHDLSHYLFSKLQGFGYPGRRLQEFKSKFVKQTIDADGTKRVEILIPDSYYGRGEQISDRDFNTMAKEIQHKFNLFFEGAERSDGKLTIKFTSVNNDQEGEGEEDFDNDELSKTYGNPGKNFQPEAKAAGSTIHEMIKNNKANLVASLVRALYKGKD